MPEVRALNAGSRSDRVVPVPGRSVSAVQCDLAGSLELRGMFVDLLRYGGRQTGSDGLNKPNLACCCATRGNTSSCPRVTGVYGLDKRLRSGQTNCPICRD